MYSVCVREAAPGLRWLEDVLKDARFGARVLRRAPVVTAVALVTLTLAIGATTAIFSLVDPLLFRDLPVREPARLMQFSFQYPRDPPLNMFSLAHYERYRDQSTAFSDVLGLAPLMTASRMGRTRSGRRSSPVTSSRRSACAPRRDAC